MTVFILFVMGWNMAVTVFHIASSYVVEWYDYIFLLFAKNDNKSLFTCMNYQPLLHSNARVPSKEQAE